MTKYSVESSNIDEIGYDRETSVLQVTFKNGVTWEYYDVSEYVLEEFLMAESKGSYFHHNIKQYNGTRVS